MKQENVIQECVENLNVFEDRIKKDEIYSFAIEPGQRKVGVAKGKIIEAALKKCLFGSILCLSVQQKINIADILKYLFTHAPLCLSHTDGSRFSQYNRWFSHNSVNSTRKSNLLNYIDLQFVTVPPLSIHATIIDAVFFCTSK